MEGRAWLICHAILGLNSRIRAGDHSVPGQPVHITVMPVFGFLKNER